MMNHWVTEQEMEEFRQRYVPDVLLVPLSAFLIPIGLGMEAVITIDIWPIILK